MRAATQSWRTIWRIMFIFQSTLPMRAATHIISGISSINTLHFNPRCPCGQRPPTPSAQNTSVWNFNPRCPCGQRQQKTRGCHDLRNFNPRCPCGQRPEGGNLVPELKEISIHAAHAGSDVQLYLNPVFKPVFQSTLPMRAATYGVTIYKPRWEDFNPRCPCGQRRFFLGEFNGFFNISIHAAHAGSDDGSCFLAPAHLKFQSTLPMRAATASHGYCFGC